MILDDTARSIGATQEPASRIDGAWTTIPGLDAREMARTMRAAGRRFVTMTVTPRPEGAFRFIYHWDVEGTLLNVVTTYPGPSAPSITDILPAADWVERETRDYYAIDFAGRTGTPPLMLQDSDEPGLFVRTGTICRDADPADTGWSRDESEEEGR